MKMTNKLMGLAAGVALLSSGAVSAQTIEVGLVDVDAPSTFTGILPIGSFIDTIKFTLPANSGSAYSVVNVPLNLLGNTFDLLFSSIALFSNPDGVLFNADDALLTSTIGNSASMSLNFAGTAGGNMYLTIAGVTTGTAGGIYAGAIDVAPIPLPPAVWMLGSAIVGLVTVGRRKAA